MVEVLIKATEEKFETRRELGSYTGTEEGPVLVVFGGIHGNETSGICALQKVLTKLERLQLPFRGRLIALAGNLRALEKGDRYIDMDLNRLWTNDKVAAIMKDHETVAKDISEAHELFELNKIILKEIEEAGERKIYFLDLHTTSSVSQPFISIDSLPINRKMANLFPVYTILNKPGVLTGTLTHHINEMGYPAICYEAGQHDALSSIENQEAIIWLALSAAGLMRDDDIPRYQLFYEELSKSTTEGRKNFRMAFRYSIHIDEQFKMEPGYVNFEKIKAGQILARNQKGAIKAEIDGRLFMPLYQPQGNDGFFIIEEVI
ncbi:MAG: succinylglutamate desuccinylase/aspartoacylase family protein [Bacteroidia bacterium]